MNDSNECADRVAAHAHYACYRQVLQKLHHYNMLSSSWFQSWFQHAGILWFNKNLL